MQGKRKAGEEEEEMGWDGMGWDRGEWERKAAKGKRPDTGTGAGTSEKTPRQGAMREGETEND